MREVVLLVPSHVSNKDIFLKVKGPMGAEYVQPYIAPERVGRREPEEVEALTSAKYISTEDYKRKLALAPMSPPSREEFEALRSRVEKLEQEAKRQCARVIKMEEGISDDLK